MGVKQSKRSVDITETSTKGEIEGFGNEGKVEKLIDGVVEKVAANGHVDGDLQNGGEAHLNGMEPIQNGEAAAVAAEKIMEKKESEESGGTDGAVNGTVENGEINGEAEKSAEESKSGEDKKEKKKKDKVVKKKFSFRNFSFSKKDKTKPPKEEKPAGKVEEAGIEETPNAEEKEESALPSQEPMVEMPEAKEPALPEADSAITSTVTDEAMPEPKPVEISEVAVNGTTVSEDLPPPLPVSPPPSEPLGMDLEEQDSKAFSETYSDELKRTGSSSTGVVSQGMDTMTQIIKDADQMAIETGKQIEEKATNLLKTVEERAEESMRTATGFGVSQSPEVVVQTALGGETERMDSEMTEGTAAAEEGEPITPAADDANVDSLAPKAEDSSDKHEEGAGESLADIPKDLAEEVSSEPKTEAINPDSLEVSETIPPPAPETPTGE